MGGELRIKGVLARQQRAGGGEIGDVGVDLAREDGIAGEAALLGPFDLAVPIGALDQAYGHAPARRRGQRGEPVDYGKRALAVSLHSKAEPIPAGKRRLGQHRLEQRETEVELVGLLGVDGKRHPSRPCRKRKIAQAGDELGMQPLGLRGMIAGMQCRKLHRQAGARHERGVGPYERVSG